MLSPLLLTQLSVWHVSDREDKCDALEELQEELDAVKQSEQRLRNEVRSVSYSCFYNHCCMSFTMHSNIAKVIVPNPAATRT